MAKIGQASKAKHHAPKKHINALIRDKNYAAADVVLDEALATWSKDIGFWLQRCDVFRQTGNLAKALLILQDDAPPRVLADKRALTRGFEICLELGEFTQARTWVQQLERLSGIQCACVAGPR